MLNHSYLTGASLQYSKRSRCNFEECYCSQVTKASSLKSLGIIAGKSTFRQDQSSFRLCHLASSRWGLGPGKDQASVGDPVRSGIVHEIWFMLSLKKSLSPTGTHKLWPFLYSNICGRVHRSWMERAARKVNALTVCSFLIADWLCWIGIA